MTRSWRWLGVPARATYRGVAPGISITSCRLKTTYLGGRQYWQGSRHTRHTARCLFAFYAVRWRRRLRVLMPAFMLLALSAQAC